MDGQEIRIEYRRDSVCAADDYVNHAIEIVLPKGAVLKDLVNYIHHYSEWNDYCSIPYTGGGSWWALKCDKGILALVSDDLQEVKYLSFSAETPLKNLDIKAVYGTRNFEMNTQSETNKQPKKNLLLQALIKFFLGVVILGLLIFLPAWSLHYWQGWLLMGILFIPMFIAGLVMMVKNPELLQKRLNAKEQEKEQKTVVALSGLLFMAAFVVAGLNWRFQWCVLPNWAVWVAAGVFLACYLLYAEVLRENIYLSRTIEVQEHQKVIDTGLYGIVRHPMYMATTLLFLMMPLVLASPISFAIMLFYIPLIAKRIRNEEAVLEQGLEGYSEYKQKVKYKVIPFIW